MGWNHGAGFPERWRKEHLRSEMELQVGMRGAFGPGGRMEGLKHEGSLHSVASSHFLSPIPAWALHAHGLSTCARALPHPRSTSAGLCIHTSLPRSPSPCESFPQPCGLGPALPSLKAVPCSAPGLTPSPSTPPSELQRAFPVQVPAAVTHEHPHRPQAVHVPVVWQGLQHEAVL